MWIALVIVVELVFLALFLKEKLANKAKIIKTNDETIGENIEIKITNEKMPYQKKMLLTKNEWSFYKDLKRVADKHNLHILSKIRFADLVEVKSGIDRKEWAKYFSKIKSKHIDFVLCKPENLAVLLLIELDDSSHSKDSRVERDAFVERVCEDSSYKLLRIMSSVGIEEKICKMLSLEVKEEITK